jgi:gamma-glutamyl-gamma-aminobutyrate hydrolase PuuD
VAKPLVGITTYVEDAAWGHWQLEAALIPYDYVRAIERAGGRALLVPLVHDAIRVVDIAARRIDVDLGFVGE